MKYKIRNTTPKDFHLFAFSASFFDDIATCPRFGMIKRVANKSFPIFKRSLALEAGSLMHEVFAAFRLWELERMQNLPEHSLFHAKRLFPEGRYRMATETRYDNDRDDLINIGINILNSGDFYDDPDDTRRTIANMEETVIRLADYVMPKMKRNSIWVADVNDPTAPVGIEISFDIVIEINNIPPIRIIGTLDGIGLRNHEDLIVLENKTASRLDETWRRSFETKQQITTYMNASAFIVGKPIKQAHVFGIKVKQTRSHEDIADFIETRDDESILDWLNSIAFVATIKQNFEDDVLNAPMFTHSCSRYFAPCSLLDMCSASYEDKQEMFNQMVQSPLSPSQNAILQMWKDKGEDNPFPNVDVNEIIE